MNIPNASPALYNADLAPATERNWGAFSIFNVWTSDVHSLWGYYLAASLFLLCGTFTNFLIAIGLGSLVIFFLMNLVGYAGVKTGVPYPVLARASFGIWGANVPALVRAIVACFWYGAQTAAASGAIAPTLGSPPSATRRAAPAVSCTATASIVGCSARKRWTCPSATGCESTFFRPSTRAPGSASRQCRIERTTSPTTSSSVWRSASSAGPTDPTRVFSTGSTP